MKCSRPDTHQAFTLLELLAVIVIIGVLAAIALPIYNHFSQESLEMKTLSNMRQMGTALMLYAGDHNSQLPNRVQNAPDPTQTAPKWPTLLQPYVQNLDVYCSPIPNANGKSYKITDTTKYSSNSINYTSYIYNGFNDMGAYTDPTYIPRINLVDRTASTILLGIPYPQTGQFYMDLSEGAGNNNDILNRTAYPNGSIYVFFDGSARILAYSSTVDEKSEPKGAGVYSDWYWLVNKANTSVIQ